MAADKTDPKQSPQRSSRRANRLAPFQIEYHGDRKRLKIFWRRCFAWAGISLVLLWQLSVAGLYCFVKYNSGYPEVQYKHILSLPFSLQAYRQAKGEFLLKIGKEQFAQRNYMEAFANLRMGLQQAPQDIQARRYVAELYFAINRPDLAVPMLVDGLPYHVQDLDYLQWMLVSLLRTQQDDSVVEITNSILSTYKLPPNQRHVVIMAQASAYYFRARYAEAEAALARYSTTETTDGMLLLARILWERGDWEKAIQLLRKAFEQNLNNEEVYRDYIATLRRSGRFEDMRRVALMKRLHDPDKHQSYIDALLALYELKEEKKLQEEESDFLRIFQDSPSALDSLAVFASQTGRPQLCQRLYDLSRAKGEFSSAAATGLVESFIVSREYQKALDAIDRLSKENPDWATKEKPAIEALKAIATYATGDAMSAHAILVSYLNETRQRTDLMVLSAQRFLALGGEQLARLAFSKAVELDPQNQTALQQLLELDLKNYQADDLPRNILRLVALRKPPLELLRTLRTQLESDKYLFLPDREKLLGSLDLAIR